MFQDENAFPPKPLNLEKIFTPADGEQILPNKNSKFSFPILNLIPDIENEYQSLAFSFINRAFCV